MSRLQSASTPCKLCYIIEGFKCLRALLVISNVLFPCYRSSPTAIDDSQHQDNHPPLPGQPEQLGGRPTTPLTTFGETCRPSASPGHRRPGQARTFIRFVHRHLVTFDSVSRSLLYSMIATHHTVYQLLITTHLKFYLSIKIGLNVLFIRFQGPYHTVVAYSPQELRVLHLLTTALRTAPCWSVSLAGAF